jgi:hypothetical protein
MDLIQHVKVLKKKLENLIQHVKFQEVLFNEWTKYCDEVNHLISHIKKYIK